MNDNLKNDWRAAVDSLSEHVSSTFTNANVNGKRTANRDASLKRSIKKLEQGRGSGGRGPVEMVDSL